MFHRACFAACAALSAALLVSTAIAQTPREDAVRGDKERIEDDESWIYNDLDQAKKLAAAESKPLLVIFRCLPCEACALFDEQVVRRDETVRALMDRFLCVRIPMANAMDLAQFQFDYDLSFAAFFMNADGTIYGRFGTRSHAPAEEAEKDISLPGFAAALDGALRLHAAYPGNKALLAGKQPRPTEYKSPDDYPSLSGKYKDRLDYEGKVVQSCLHCHQIRDAERQVIRNSGRPMPAGVLFPYPMPQTVGFSLDPQTRGSVSNIAADSAAGEAGLKQGDELLLLGGQPILSIADVQWALHNAPAEGKLPALVRRDGATSELALQLDPGWRSRSDISWRTTTWPLRAMVAGGMRLEPLDEEGRRELKIADGEMALLVRHAGRYGVHAAAHNAGVRPGDVVVSAGGRSDLMTESALFEHLLTSARVGERVDFGIVHEGTRRTVPIPMQKAGT